MKHFAKARLAAVVALLGFALLLASNHCALGGMTVAKGSEEHSCCREKGQPAAFIECCTSMHAALPLTLSAPVTQLFELHPLWDQASALLVVPSPVLLSLSAFAATGPPVPSFAETVLNRSLLAHAPPLFVV